MNRDRVILKRCRALPREVVAFFPDDPANPGCILSYLHIGQHGEASLAFYRDCRPVSRRDPEAAKLLRELRDIGYRPRIVRRLPAHWRAPL